MKQSSRHLPEGILGIIIMVVSLLLLFLLIHYMYAGNAGKYAFYILRIGELPFPLGWLAIPVGGLLLMFPFYWGLQWVYSYFGKRLRIDSFGERVLAAVLGLPLMAIGLYATYLIVAYVVSDTFRLDSSQGIRVGVVPIPFELIGYIFLWGLTQLPVVWGVRLLFFSITSRSLRS